MENSNTHIGVAISSVIKENGVSKADLARLLAIKPQSVDYLLKRKSIDTDMLYKVSVALNYDFSKLYSINQTNSNQINFDIMNTPKVLVEISLNHDDVIKLNLKNRILKVIDK